MPAGTQRSAAPESDGRSAQELLSALRAARSAQRRRKKERKKAAKEVAARVAEESEAAPAGREQRGVPCEPAQPHGMEEAISAPMRRGRSISPGACASMQPQHAEPSPAKMQRPDEERRSAGRSQRTGSLPSRAFSSAAFSSASGAAAAAETAKLERSGGAKLSANKAGSAKDFFKVRRGRRKK